ncbi:hypothetical protein BDN67DRAFT_1805 [Paxillus ammoniavirescens]|nr:hypothetical protein BDN67DRAFT_1805 [Paxillus ammoniavirescens]
MSGLPSYEVANGGGDGFRAPPRPMSKGPIDESDLEHDPNQYPPAMMLHPNRRTNDGDIELGAVVDLTEVALAKHNSILRGGNVNRLALNWRSPIELGTGPPW